ncbi:hypothetical protein SDC9_210107 [bioreactor metagenome]|uniref:Uncharacterized protein n=1 Tax=bioreactor metagenome TaxID=1076179 RepID=A0A645JGX3_9ZZZZ
MDEDGQTPLYVAAGENRIEFVQLFIENGAAIDLTGNTTPFQIACAFNYYDIADVLYRAGAQVNYADSDGRTALFYATVKQNKKLISYLLSIGANEDIIDNEGIHLKDLSNDEIRKKLYDELY